MKKTENNAKQSLQKDQLAENYARERRAWEQRMFPPLRIKIIKPDETPAPPNSPVTPKQHSKG